ncbi:sigma-70 family RNA polymerase sigma factor [Chloroflexota bacterium]
MTSKEAEKKEKQEALANLYEEYYDKIARYIFTKLGDQTQAEDLASEVFLKALRSLGSYEERGIKMESWLFRIAHNLIVDHFRKATKHRTIPIDTVEIESEEDPVKIAETNIEFEKVSQAMKKLGKEQREVLELRFFGGLTSKETGNVLKKNDGAIRQMQHAAVEKLRALLVADHQANEV